MAGFVQRKGGDQRRTRQVERVAESLDGRLLANPQANRDDDTVRRFGLITDATGQEMACQIRDMARYGLVGE
ncbi:hypothetical protein [Rhodopila globiformis]|uniref:Uncharacterized protein n=1 Tax=Rhodopila globiformis TaxID=1071 RepID=A0A2S6NL76_RHOGL|nr:hypothetical protein [Rhodopila globiformis]PPQ35961.1 hypothetical protein CCS01_06110 [Rhodopila globiformis]